jgi:hypothetical protein
MHLRLILSQRAVCRFSLSLILFFSLMLPLRAGGGETFPAGHWAYDIIEQLVVRGHLARLNDVAQPYERVDVARALLEIDKSQLGDRSALWMVNKLEQELSDEIDWLRDEAFPEVALRLGIRPEFIGDKRDGLFPELQLPPTTIGGNPGSTITVPGASGNTFGPRFRNRFRVALHFGKDFVVYNNTMLQQQGVFDASALVSVRNFAGTNVYTEQGFVAYHGDIFRMKFGRDYVNWGYGRQSLTLANSAGPLDQLWMQLYSRTIRFTYLAAQLDKYKPTPSSEAIGERYLSTIRMDFNLFANKWRFGFFQTTIFSGVNRPFDLRVMNPFLFSYSEQANATGAAEINPNVGADMSIYTFGLNLYASMLIDDWQVAKESLNDLEPNLWSGQLGVRAPNILRGLKIYGTDFFIEANRVRNRTYHNRFNVQQGSAGAYFGDQRAVFGNNPLGPSLGTDFTSLELGVSHWFRKDLRVGISTMLINKGEGNLYGDYTQPWLDSLNGQPRYNLQSGYDEPLPYFRPGITAVEKRNALRFNIFYQPSSAVNVELQLTQVWRTNADNVIGVNKSDLQVFARAMVELQPLFTLF